MFSLTVQDTTVRGTGTYTGDAMVGGTLAVDGVISGTTVHLDLTFNPQQGGAATAYHFNGQLSGPDMLIGALWTTSDPVPATFTRVRQ